MKHCFKITSVLLILALIMLPFSVFATDTIQITGHTYVDTGVDTYYTLKYSTTNGNGYCISPNRNGPSVGDTLTFKENVNDGTMLYLLDKTGSDDNSFMTSQLALWKYYNGYERPGSDSVWNTANAKIAEAKNNSSYSTAPSVALKPESSTLTIKDSYYISDEFTLSAKNTTSLTVSLEGAPTDAKIVGTDGKEITSFKDGSKFIVTVPTTSVTKDSTFNVKVEGKGTVKTVKKYVKDSNTQEIVVVVPEEKTVTATAKLSVSTVKKCEYKDGKYFDKDGNLTDEATYRSQCLPKCEYKDGKYYDKDGNVTDEATYIAQCTTVIVVPDTGDVANYVFVIVGALLIGGTVFGLKYKKKLVK